MSKLQIFNNSEFGTVRTMTLNGEPYFVGKDVAEILGYAKPENAIATHVDDEDKTTTLIQGTGSNYKSKSVVISESGLYSLILSSKLPTAKKFKRWVTSEVLPTIRKTGGYVNNEETFINTYLPYTDEQTQNMFRATLKTIQSLNAKIERDKPKVLFADAVETAKTTILIGDLAKILKQNGCNTGQKRLFAWLRENGYLIKSGNSKNMPTQRSMDMQLFEVKETTIANADGSIRVTRTTKVTGRGQQYFVSKLLSNNN